MADTKKDTEQTSRKPFVAQSDRPEVRIKLDAPISELRVRDLAAILRLGSQKDFWDGKDWLKDDFDGGIKWWKEKEKDKDKEKDKEKEKDKDKREKTEKLEKHEIKEVKAEKLENDGVFEPTPFPRPDPQIDGVIRALAGLSERVSQLADQVEELKKQRKA
jgi:hypothetical protein